MRLRLPFVSRRAYYDQRRQLKLAERRHAEVLAMLTEERNRTEHLVDTIVSLKLGGATLVRHMLANEDGSAKKLTPRTPSAIQQAIDENPRAANNPALRRYLTEWAEKELRKPSELSLEQQIRDVVMRLKTWNVAELADDDEDDEGDEGYLEFDDADEAVEAEAGRTV